MSRKRRKRNCLLLFIEDSSHKDGMRPVKPLSFESGEKGVEAMRLDHVRDDNHQLLGYIAKSFKHRAKPEPVPTNRFDPTSITRREMEANAGLLGRSQTAGLSDEERKSRIYGEVDFIERTQQKIAAYSQSANFHTGDKAVRVYPKAVQAAMQVLGQ